ncbi:MAG: uracil-DNA glycosylase [Planctomycetota bacterium]|jgi:uracil-DNA glycosylase family 4
MARDGRRSLRLRTIAGEIERCERCPRLREWCRRVGREKRRAYADETYWAKPVPGFGDPEATVVVVGLAPGAHGANRTGRLFTGDRSGDFLYACLQRDDGLVLSGAFISAAGRCAPPANRPTPEELAACRPFLVRELEVLEPRVLVALGSLAWNASLAALADLGLGEAIPRPKPRFAHAAETTIGDARISDTRIGDTQIGDTRIGEITLLGAYHPSQQNTFTKRLTPPMLDAVFLRARTLAEG